MRFLFLPHAHTACNKASVFVSERSSRAVFMLSVLAPSQFASAVALGTVSERPRVDAWMWLTVLFSLFHSLLSGVPVSR